MTDRLERRRTELQEALLSLRVGAPPALSWFTSELRAVLQARASAAYLVHTGAEGPQLDFGHAAGFPDDLYARLGRHWRGDGLHWNYDPANPEPEQRNRVVTPPALALAKSPERVQRAIDEHQALGIDLRGQVRALICDGPSLLSLVAVYVERDEPRAEKFLAGLLEPLAQRLKLERELQGAMLRDATLTAALDGSGAAAFIVGPRGTAHANTLGKNLLDREPEIARALHDLALGRQPEVPFEVTRLSVPGAPEHKLAMLRSDPADPSARAQRLSQRFRLTGRQHAVLVQVARGLPNRTIADVLDCAERTVEQHLRILFDKIGVDSRAALVARFWTAS